MLKIHGKPIPVSEVKTLLPDDTEHKKNSLNIITITHIFMEHLLNNSLSELLL